MHTSTGSDPVEVRFITCAGCGMDYDESLGPNCPDCHPVGAPTEEVPVAPRERNGFRRAFEKIRDGAKRVVESLKARFARTSDASATSTPDAPVAPTAPSAPPPVPPDAFASEDGLDDMPRAPVGAEAASEAVEADAASATSAEHTEPKFWHQRSFRIACAATAAFAAVMALGWYGASARRASVATAAEAKAEGGDFKPSSYDGPGMAASEARTQSADAKKDAAKQSGATVVQKGEVAMEFIRAKAREGQAADLGSMGNAAQAGGTPIVASLDEEEEPPRVEQSRQNARPQISPQPRRESQPVSQPTAVEARKKAPPQKEEVDVRGDGGADDKAREEPRTKTKRRRSVLSPEVLMAADGL